MEFTPEQTAATEAPAKPVQFIKASAGSGKTTVAAARIRQLIATGTDPARITAITFTRAGGKALSDKIGVPLHWSGTLHALAMRELGIDPATLMTDDEADDEIAHCLTELQIKGTSLKAAKAALADPGMQLGNAGLFVRGFGKRLANAGKTTFDMVLRDFLKRLRSERTRGGVLLVDEAQDTAPMDAAIYQAMEAENLIVVGDFKQAIFAFRGANNKFMAQCLTVADCYPLTTTFRCSQQVTALANGVLERNLLHPQAMRHRNGAPNGHADYLAFHEQRDEEDFLLHWAQNKRRCDGNACILARNNHTVDRLRDAFSSAGIAVSPRLRERDSGSYKLAVALLRGIITGKPLEAIRAHHPRPEAYVQRWDSDRNLAHHLTGLHDLRERLTACGAPDSTLSACDAYNDATEALEAMLESGDVDDTTGIHIDTIHASKGREWACVALAEATEALDNGDQAQNLIYVAVTRAKLEFVATFAQNAADPWSGARRTPKKSKILLEAFGEETD